jgi:predicted nuclease with RNAse H fold
MEGGPTGTPRRLVSRHVNGLQAGGEGSGGGRRADSGLWAGVDVGAGKGFDVAVVDAERLVAPPRRIVAAGEVVDYLAELRPAVVAVDSPKHPAPAGLRSRAGERELVKAGVCGIRYTPDERSLRGNEAYYGWILNGLRLYDALGRAPGLAEATVIECFPTASWSRLGGSRGKRTRARWSRAVLRAQGLAGLPARMNQDARDAVGAALTARLHAAGSTERFGEIVVPLG